MLIQIIESGTIPDLKFAWTVPTGATITGQTGAAFAWRGSSMSNFNTDATVAQTVQTATVSVIGGLFFKLVMGGTAGNCILQWAQATSTASDTTMKSASTLIAYQEGTT